MIDHNQILEMVFDNIKKFFFPEEWLTLDLEMSKQEILILIVTSRHGEIIMSQVADYINIPMSTATGIIDRLVKKGFIVRDRNETDRRVVTIKLTEKGKAFTDRMKEQISDYLGKIYDSLTEEERMFLYKVANKIIGVMSDYTGNESSEAETGSSLEKIEIE